MSGETRWQYAKAPDHEFKTKDHPAARGRKPLAEEREYVATFPIENGATLTVRMGKRGMLSIARVLGQMIEAEQKEGK